MAEPVLQAMSACGFAPLMRWIWELALTSVGLKETSETSSKSLYSGLESTSLMI